ncbi:MAG: RNA 2',3'-cyclic phosphodiesterase [Armatimonadota bacterium]
MDKIRAFIAVRLPDHAKIGLAGIEKKLMASGADVKWVAEENFHITLKFLGDVEIARLDAVIEAVRSAADGIESFEAELSGTGAFPRPSRPSVVWVGITSGGEQLKVLADRIESALEPFGFAREARGFSPHITLGRTRSQRNVERLQEAISALKHECVDNFRVNSIAVVKSTLKPSGSVYTVIEEIALS